MLGEQGFDLWSGGYDKSVGLSDEVGSYPFTGYKQILNAIYGEVLSKGKPAVLDIGFGTGTLAAKLYERGCVIWGVDFSRRMLELARPKMPNAILLQADFSQELPEELRRRTYDYIVATYSLHHLTDQSKIGLIESLLPMLKEGGKILIGDVAFANRCELEACRETCGDGWDEEEFYFVCDELAASLSCGVKFQRFSFCAGILTIQP